MWIPLTYCHVYPIWTVYRPPRSFPNIIISSSTFNMCTENVSTPIPEKSWQWIYIIVVLVSLGWRIIWAGILSTVFVPDEYYQTVEPSFNFINRYDSSFHRENTWEWQEGYEIRSYVPLIPYLLFHAMGRFLRTHVMIPSSFLAVGPRIVQGCIAAVGDTLLYIIVQKVSSNDGRNATNHHRIATIVWMVHLLSWSGMYCMSRTLINSLETVLLVVAVYFTMDTSEDHHHHHNNSGSNIIQSTSTSLLLPITVPSPSPPLRIPTSIILPCVAALTVHSRPTSLLFLAPLLILKLSAHKQPVRAFFLRYLPSGISVLMMCVVFDTWCYTSYRQAAMITPSIISPSSSPSSSSSPPQEHHQLSSIVTTFTAYLLPNLTSFISSITATLVITPYNFFHINVYRNYASLYYGSQPWHWAYSQGLPVMLGLYLPPVLYGMMYTSQPRVMMMFQVLAVLSIVLQVISLPSPCAHVPTNLALSSCRSCCSRC